MKIRPLIVALCLLVAGMAQAAVEPDFRQTCWGMTVEQVKLMEDAELLGGEQDRLIYQDYVADMNCYIFYEFIDNKLYSGRYLFPLEHIYEDEYITDYEEIKELMTYKYGTPILDHLNWLSDTTFRDDPSDWGLAVEMGYLRYNCQWEFERTDIYLELGGEEFDTILALHYSSKEYASLAEEAKKDLSSKEYAALVEEAKKAVASEGL